MTAKGSADSVENRNKDTARIAIRGSAVRVVALATSTVVAFLVMPFLVHSLGDRTYGFWSLAGTILGYYGLLDLGIVSAVQFYVASAAGEKDPAAANRALSTAFYAFAALGFVVAIATVLVSFLAPHFIHSTSEAAVFRRVILIMGIGFAVGFPGRAFIGALSAYMRWDLISSVGMGALALRTTLIVIAIKHGGGIISLAAITVLVDGFSYLAYYAILARIQDQFRLSARLASFQSLKGVLRYSGFTLIVRISDQLRFQLDAFVVTALLSVAAVTHYAIASRLAFAYRELMIAIFGILSPLFSQLLGSKDVSRIKRMFEFTTKMSTAAACLIACGIILYGRLLIDLWMGPKYLDAYWPLVFLSIGICFEMAQIPSMSYMYGVSKHHFLAYVNLGEGVMNLILSLWLGRRYGMSGVALGTLIPMAVMWFLVQPIYVCHQIGIPAREFYTRLVGRPMVITMVGMLAPWFLVFGRITQRSAISLAVSVVCQAAIGAAVVYVFLLDREEKSWVVRPATRMRPQAEQATELITESLP